MQFLRTCFKPADWIALFLKNYRTGRVAQRVGSLPWATSDSVQAWLRAMNARSSYNVYVSVNAIRQGERSRTRGSVSAVRHVFLEVDENAAHILRRVEARTDLPPLSYLLHSSPGRMHIFWRVEGFSPGQVERLQKLLASQLGTDPAATPVTQTTRIPGFFNHKHDVPHLVTAEYRDISRAFTSAQFPTPPAPAPIPQPHRRRARSRGMAAATRERAGRYLREIPPAIAGQHGDLHTFQTCCRIARGFALDDDEAFEVLVDWNARCQPPWTEGELRDKIRRARLYGRERIGGLL